MVPAEATSTAPTFTVVDLGIIGKTYGSTGVGISQNGKYAAVQSNTSVPTHAAIYHAGKLKKIGTFGGEDSFAYGVNNTGTLVGAARDTSQLERAFTYTAGVLTQLPDLGGNYSAAQAINDHGLIVGAATVADGSPRAVEWAGGQLSTLPGLSAASEAQANAVNDSGDVAGWSWGATNSLPEHAILWKDGQMTDLFPDPLFSNEPYSINQADAIVGGACVGSYAPCTDGAWLWYDGVSNSYQLATGGVHGIARGINDHWMIVGRGTLPNQSWIPWMIFNGQLYNLNSLLAPGTTGWTIGTPEGVDDEGDIIATAGDATNRAHAVLLIPNATPAWDTTKPHGTIALDGGATSTSSAAVPLVATGSDASGIFAVRISNAPAVGSDHRLVDGITVDPSTVSSGTPLSWDLTNPATGGTSTPGVHIVYVQWVDWTGHWSTPKAASITLN